MRAAVVGAGRIGSFHARNLAKTEGVEQIVVVDASEDAARTLAESLRDTLGVVAEVATSLDPVLAAGVDLVVVAAPTSMHAAVTLQAIESGTPVFCEKPGAVDLDEATRLVAAADASGVPVQIGFQRRFDPPIRAAAEARRRGEVGTLFVARFSTHDHEPPDITYEIPHSSLFTETLIHDIDALRFVTGDEVVRVMAMSGEHGAVRHAGLLAELAGGAQAVLTAAWQNPCGYDVRVELLGDRDCITVGYGDAPQLRRLDVAGGDDPTTRRIPGFIERFEVAYREELQAFVDCVLTGTPPQVGVRDAHAALAVALAAWQSQRSGEPVDIPQLAVNA